MLTLLKNPEFFVEANKSELERLNIELFVFSDFCTSHIPHIEKKSIKYFEFRINLSQSNDWYSIG